MTMPTDLAENPGRFAADPRSVLPMLRDALLAVGLAYSVGAALGGSSLGVAAAGCAALAAGNLAIYRLLVTRLTADLAAGGDGGLAGLALSGKLMVTLVIVASLLAFVDAAAVVVGLVSALAIATLGAALTPTLEEASA